MLRSPAVAGQFYPGSEASLLKTLSALVPEIQPEDRKEALAVVSPHAGYIYSGGVAGETFARVKVPESIVILGPNHTGNGAPIALEHSLEVQIPFLQYIQKDLSIAPIVVSHVPYESCVAVGQGLAAAIKSYGKPVLIVASTDMTHYESRQAASAKDSLALARIQELDPEGLYNTVIGKRISMCGIMPATVALIAALALGAKKAELVRYTDSGETSGDTSQVVGYAGLVIS